jgi:anti-sigma factor RsiW
MSCMDARTLMDAALDGERPPELGAHLASCESCAREWSALVALEARLRAPAAVRLPDGFHTRTMVRIDLDPRMSWQRRSEVRAVLSVLTVVAGCLMLAVGLMAVAQALRQPGEVRAWLDVFGQAADWVAGAAGATVPAFGRSLWVWTVYGAVSVALALIWFGALVLPRQSPSAVRRP